MKNLETQRQEARVRKLAERNGYHVKKLRGQWNLDNQGEFMLIRNSDNIPMLGFRFDASLDEIEAYFAEEEGARPMSQIAGDGTVFVGERKILLEERTVNVIVNTTGKEVSPINVAPEIIKHASLPIKIKGPYAIKPVSLELYLYPDGTMKFE